MADLHLGVIDDKVDAEQLEQLALLLRRELLELEIDRVEPQPVVELPAGTRSAAGTLAGALVVYVKPTIDAIGALIVAVRSWLNRGDRNRRVRLEIGGDVLELAGVTTDLQHQLADEWIRRHAIE